MANTIIIYSGDGKTTDFKVPFDYLKKSFVKILVNGRELVGGNYGDPSKDYYFLDPTTVRLLKAPPTKAEVVVKRFTSATERVVSFKDASIFKAKDLDASTLQATHIAEEGRDVVTEALFMDKERNWDAKNKRIVNLADPVDDKDAINYKTYKADANGAYQSRIASEKAQKAAEDARDIATNKMNAASVSERNAKESEVNAKASETKTKEYLDKAETVNVTTNDLLKKAEEYKVDFDSTAENVYTNAEVAKQKAQEASKSEASAKASATLASSKADSAGASEKVATAKANEVKKNTSKVTEMTDTVTQKASEVASHARTVAYTDMEVSNKRDEVVTKHVEVLSTARQVSKDATSASVSKDRAMQFSETAKLWAISDTLVEGIDYSSKYYAQKAKESADIATEGQVQADWNEVDTESKAYIKNKPDVATKADLEANKPTWDNITGKPDVATKADLEANKPTWDNITGKPDVATKADLEANKPTWDNITGKPSAYPPKAHRHPTSDIDGLSETLEGVATEVGSLTNKVNGVGDLIEQNKPKAYIIETWKNGTEWYRKYSNGWLEQGGRAVGGDWNSPNTVTLHVPFSSTYYGCLTAVAENSHKSYVYTVYACSYTKTTFGLVTGHNGSNSDNLKATWYAYGYYK